MRAVVLKNAALRRYTVVTIQRGPEIHECYLLVSPSFFLAVLEQNSDVKLALGRWPEYS